MNSYSKLGKEKVEQEFRARFLKHLTWIWSAMFLLAIGFVWLLSPTLDAIDKWADRDIMHGLYIFLTAIGLFSCFLIWVRFKK